MSVAKRLRWSRLAIPSAPQDLSPTEVIDALLARIAARRLMSSRLLPLSIRETDRMRAGAVGLDSHKTYLYDHGCLGTEV
jgi:hypothetical protein